MLTLIIIVYVATPLISGGVTVWALIHASKDEDTKVVKTPLRLPEPEPNVPSALEEWDAKWIEHQRKQS